MSVNPDDQANASTFTQLLRYAIVETWKEIQALQRDPPTSAFFRPPSPLGIDMVFTLAAYLTHLIDIGQWRESGTDLSANRRSSSYMGQAFMDEGSVLGHVPLMQTIQALDYFWYQHGNAWEVPVEGVFDEASRDVIAVFQPWSVTYFSERLARIEAKERLKRDAARAGLPPTRRLPHDPDPGSIKITRNAALAQLTAWQPRLPGSDGLGNPTTESARMLAEQHLIAGFTGHWFMAAPADTFAALHRAADYAVLGLPSDPALHAWTYEQWQHVAIAAKHQALGDTLWELRRETWDHNRIRPVNWLICRIRILDLFHHGGRDDEIRELMETCRLGLFAEQLPSELQPDFPLMRNWYHLLHAIVHRDQPRFDEHLIERQSLLADHWKRGGGIAAVSLFDLGGLALLRTARLRGLKPVTFGGAYLTRELQSI